MSVGSIVALPITPYIADIAGRRAGVMTGCLIMILGVVLQSIGINIAMFIAARFLIGFGVAIAHGAAPLLIAELVHPQHRAIFTTIYNSTWYLGSIVAAVSNILLPTMDFNISVCRLSHSMLSREFALILRSFSGLHTVIVSIMTNTTKTEFI